MIGFAIVGCGMISRFHAKALAEVPAAKIVAVYDTDLGRARKFAEEQKLGDNVHDDLSSMLSRKDVDIVIVSTPSGAHMEPAVAAAQAGKHVVLEKPLEVTLERCDRIIDACDKNNVKLCTIFQSRFGDANQELKKAVTAGRFGRLTLGETTCKWWRPQSYYDQGGWRGTWALDGGGALMNQAIHNVDLLLWMMGGNVTHITGFTALLAHERIEVEDTAVACLRFDHGALGVLQATTSISPGYPKTIAIHGDKGSAVIEQDDLLRWDFSPELPQDDLLRKRYAQKSGGTGGSSDPSAISHTGHARQLTDFVRSIQSGAAPSVDGREGRRAVQVILGVYEANKTGRVVKLSQ